MKCSNCEYVIPNKKIAFSWPDSVSCPSCKSNYNFMGGGLLGVVLLFALVIAVIGTMAVSPYFDVVENDIHKKTVLSYLFYTVFPVGVVIFGVDFFGKTMKKYVSRTPSTP